MDLFDPLGELSAQAFYVMVGVDKSYARSEIAFFGCHMHVEFHETACRRGGIAVWVFLNGLGFDF